MCVNFPIEGAVEFVSVAKFSARVCAWILFAEKYSAVGAEDAYSHLEN